MTDRKKHPLCQHCGREVDPEKVGLIAALDNDGGIEAAWCNDEEFAIWRHDNKQKNLGGSR